MPKITFEEPTRMQAHGHGTTDPRSRKVAAGRAAVNSLEQIETKLGGIGGPSGTLLKVGLAEQSTVLYVLNSNLELLKTHLKKQASGHQLKFELAIEEDVFDFFVFDEYYLAVMCVEISRVLFFKQGHKVKELENGFLSSPHRRHGLTKT